MCQQQGEVLAGYQGITATLARRGNAALTSSNDLPAPPKKSAALTSHWTNIRPSDREQARARPIGCWSTPHYPQRNGLLGLKTRSLHTSNDNLLSMLSRN